MVLLYWQMMRQGLVKNIYRFFVLFGVVIVIAYGAYNSGFNRGALWESSLRKNTDGPAFTYPTVTITPTPNEDSMDMDDLVNLNTTFETGCHDNTFIYKNVSGYYDLSPKYSCSISVGSLYVPIGIYFVEDKKPIGVWLSEMEESVWVLSYTASVVPSGRVNSGVIYTGNKKKKVFVTKKGKRAYEIKYEIGLTRGGAIIDKRFSETYYVVDFSTSGQSKFMLVGDPYSYLLAGDDGPDAKKLKIVERTSLMDGISFWFADNADVKTN